MLCGLLTTAITRQGTCSNVHYPVDVLLQTRLAPVEYVTTVRPAATVYLCDCAGTQRIVPQVHLAYGTRERVCKPCTEKGLLLSKNKAPTSLGDSSFKETKQDFACKNCDVFRTVQIHRFLVHGTYP